MGHQGVIKMYLTISDKFFVPNLIHYLRSYVKGCHLFQLAHNEKLATSVQNKSKLCTIVQAKYGSKSYAQVT